MQPRRRRLKTPPEGMGADPLADELREALGPEHVLVDRDVVAGYETDWTGRWTGTARFVVRPGSTSEVSRVMAACCERGVPVVVQGGNTGLVGGSVPRPGSSWREAAVVLSALRLSELGEVDAGAMQVTAGSGVTLAAWRGHARHADLDTPVDFASRDSATVGGAIATNAGGSRVVRFGTMRSQVAGIEAVLADGSVIGSLAGLPKETVGLHWPSVLAGSEGTLGVITAARLRLAPWFRQVATAMVATADIDAAVSLLARLRGELTCLDSIEIVLPEALELVAAHLSATPPVSGGGAYVLVECADHRDPVDELVAVLDGSDEVLDSAMSTDGPGRNRLIQFRDRITESIAASGVPLKLDVAVPPAALGELVHAARRTVDGVGGRLIAFGHLAEGNMHLNVLEPGNIGRITESVLATASRLGGTISAEHGIGLAKTPWLHLARSSAELSAAAAVRSALDPRGILNPGVLAPL
ncbi:MAG: FAD-binding oxidoreductase [Actinomycetota bacterium]|nr:FAD-binding oxidoreductase [Actinomycetota bacterium]